MSLGLNECRWDSIFVVLKSPSLNPYDVAYFLNEPDYNYKCELMSVDCKLICNYVITYPSFRVRAVSASIPTETDEREYEVYSPETQELYVFNRFGQHIATKNILTGEVSYSFTYSVNTSSGKLSTITDTAGNKVFLLRDYSSQVSRIYNIHIGVNKITKYLLTLLYSF